MNSKRPEHIRVGQIDVAIWENIGKIGTYKTISLQKNYKRNGMWNKTSSLRVSDLPKAILALQKAYEQIMTR